MAVTLDDLFDAFGEARALTGHGDFVVVGSLSILGAVRREIPAGMVMSNDVDCYMKEDPERIFDVIDTLGEHSAYHREHGLYLDGVSPGTLSLPDGWFGRLHRVARAGLQLWFLDPADAALSKYARGEPCDRRWIRAGLVAGLIPFSAVDARFSSTNFLDASERRRVRSLIDADRTWLKKTEGVLSLHRAVIRS